MKLFILIVSTLLLSTLAAPPREKRQHSKAAEIIGTVKLIKDPESYEAMMAFTDIMEAYFAKTDDTAESELYAKVQEGMKIRLELLKEIMPEGAKPTEERITEIAKKLAKHLRDIGPIRVRDLKHPDTIMTKDAIEVLKQIVLDTPVKNSGNNFLDILKEKIPKAGIAADVIKKTHNHIKDVLKKGDRLDEPDLNTEEREAFSQFAAEFLFNELVQLMKNDDNAVVFFKSIAVFVDTLKDPASYDSLQTFYNGLARSKRLEAKAILVRETGKCFGAELSAVKRRKWQEHFSKLMATAKAILADGQDAEEAEKIFNDFEANDLPELAELWEEMMSYDQNTETRQRVRKCLVSDDDRKIFKEALEISDAVFSDEQLAGLKAKNERVYAVVYLVNSLVRAVRRRDGLEAEADAFFKEVVTTPNSLMRVADFFVPSQETIDKIEAQKKLMTAKFNGLSAEAKKEFIDMFPYRGIYNLALMD